MLRKPLARCVNGCDAPPKLPSFVLCAKCFAVLDAKMRALADSLPTPPPEPACECGGTGAIQVRVMRTVAAHDPNCDGRCLNCPVATQVEDYEVEPCPNCRAGEGGGR